MFGAYGGYSNIYIWRYIPPTNPPRSTCERLRQGSAPEITMTTSGQAEFQVTRLKAALLGLIGTGLGSFLPGVLGSAVSVFVFGNTGGKLDPVSTLMVWVLIFGFFTAATVVAYLAGLLPLWYVARVSKPSHAFWLAVAASVFSLVAFMTGISQAIAHRLDFANREELLLVAVVTVLHLILFSILCVLYGQFVRRRQNEVGVVAGDERR
jgi:hypothetical protein